MMQVSTISGHLFTYISVQRPIHVQFWPTSHLIIKISEILYHKEWLSTKL